MEKLDLLNKVFDNQQALISSADGKASIALSLQVFIATSVLGTSILVEPFTKIACIDPTLQYLFYILFSFFLFISVIGLVVSILVFMPRPPQEEKEVNRKGIIYFGHIIKFKNSKDYLAEVNDTKEGDLIKEFAFQNYSLAQILDHKMKYVKCSTIILLINILFGIGLLLFSLLIK